MIRLLPMALRGRKKRINHNKDARCKMQEARFFLFLTSCFLFLFLTYASLTLAAALTGRVEIDGSYSIKPRKNLEERIKAERSLIVSKDGGIKDAVVSIKGLKGNNNQSLPKNAVIDQKNKTILPHVLPIPVGTAVTFKSSDPFVHRIISNSEAKRLRMEFAYEGATMDMTFEEPGIVELWCDDHKRMQAWILVMETPFFATTDENGYFTIPALPAGRYTVEIWHEVLGSQSKEIDLKEGENAKVDFRLPGKEF